MTCTGVVLFVVLPLPSWPLSFAPQHCTPPFTTAQVWNLPAATVCALAVADTSSSNAATMHTT
jgi:hypothetical protein